MKRRLIFVIPSLDAGGAERALVNLLHELDYNRFSVDLFLFHPKGIFLDSIPESVRLVPPPPDYNIFAFPLASSIFVFFKKRKLRHLFHRLRFAWQFAMEKNTALAEQKAWKFVRKSLEFSHQPYDVAIAFLEKSSIYFVVDIVQASKKIGWIHTLYSKSGLDKSFDSYYFSKLNYLIGVSESCVEELKATFTSAKVEVEYIPNILSRKFVFESSKQEIGFNKFSSVYILSIGRLVHLKGFDTAIETAKLLADKKMDFFWEIIGDGPEKDALQQQIRQMGLSKKVRLLGPIANPFPHMKRADIVVMTSRYEGKPMVLEEAKLLCKPIVTTNFTTVYDIIKDGVTGLIAEMNPQSLAQKIITLVYDEKLRRKLISNLESIEDENQEKLEKFYNLLK